MNPYLSYEGFAGIAFFLLCICLVLYSCSRTKIFLPVHMSILAMGIVYGIVMPIIMHTVPVGNFLGASFLVDSASYLLLHTLAAAIAVFCISAGWNAVPQSGLKGWGGFFAKTKIESIVLCLYIMILVAVATQYIYTIDYGGLLGYFDFNRKVRAGAFSLFERSRFSFLAPFGGFAIIACYGFWGLLLTRNLRVPIVLGFFMAFACSVYVLLADAGRIAMLVFLSVLLMSFLLNRRMPYVFWALFVPLMAPFTMFFVFFISGLLDIKAAEDMSQFVSRELSFPFISFFAQLNLGSHFDFFYEIFVFPAFFAPSSMTASWLSTASDLNTEIIMGARKGVGGITGAVPTDLLTYGLMQFHFFGIAIYAFLFGAFLRLTSALSGSFKNQGLSAVFSAYVFIKIGVFGLFYANPESIIAGSFPALVVVILVFGLKILRRQSPAHL